VLEETASVLVADDRERRPDGFEQGLSAAGLGLAQEEALYLAEGLLSNGVKIR
jgi:hypothetical protein